MKTLPATFLVVLLASGTAGAAPRARAPVKTEQNVERGAAAMNEAARLRFNEAVKLYTKKKYDKALAAFVQAYALTKNPAVLVNLGLTSLKLSDPLRAARFFSQYLNDTSSSASGDIKTRAQNGLAEARKSLGSVEIAAPEGADVTIDGEAAGRAPLVAAVDVLPGRHTINATTASGTKTEQVEATAGVTTKVRLGAPGPATPPPNAASEPEQRAPAEARPPAAPPPPEAPGFLSPPNSVAPVYVAGLVGIASLTAAIVFSGIDANAARNTSLAIDALARNGKDPSECTRAVDPTLASTCSSLASAQRASNAVKAPFIATISVGTGALAFALAWYLFGPKSVTEGKDARGPRPRITPEISAHGEPRASLDLRF
jgi:hypothetical protein